MKTHRTVKMAYKIVYHPELLDKMDVCPEKK